VRLTTSPPSCAECHEIWEPKPLETLWATPGLLRDSFILPFLKKMLLAQLTFLKLNYEKKKIPNNFFAYHHFKALLFMLKV